MYELFRDTNIKYVYDASSVVISAFAGLYRNMFVISTHILEVAGNMQQRNRIDFRFFEIVNKDEEFHYPSSVKKAEEGWSFYSFCFR